MLVVARYVSRHARGWLPRQARRCTGIVIRVGDSIRVAGRTMEFAQTMGSDVQVVKAGTQMRTLAYRKSAGQEAEGSTGYDARYGIVGCNAFNKEEYGVNGHKLNMIVDGVNDQGLYVGALYLPKSYAFANVPTDKPSVAVSSEELAMYLLATCSSVEEVQDVVQSDEFVITWSALGGGLPEDGVPVHWRAVDQHGVVVIESVKVKDGEGNVVGAKVNVYGDDYTGFGKGQGQGVLTNEPEYPDHLAQMQSYNPLPEEQLEGMPGDFSSEARFLRAAALSRNAEADAPGTDGDPEQRKGAVAQAFHVLNSFDKPIGDTRSSTDPNVGDWTLWTSAADLLNPTYYFKTHDGQRIQKLSVAEAVSHVGDGGVGLITMDDFPKPQNWALPRDTKEDIADDTPLGVSSDAEPDLAPDQMAESNPAVQR